MSKTTKKNKSEKPAFELKGMKVANVRRLSETVVAFSLLGNGLGLYNLKVVNGAKGKFVAVPQTKGKDGQWYNQYAVYMSETDQRRVIEKVEEMMKDEEDDEDEEDGSDTPF